MTALSQVPAIETEMSVYRQENTLSVDVQLTGVDRERLLESLNQGYTARITWKFRLQDFSYTHQRIFPEIRLFTRRMRRDPLQGHLVFIHDDPSHSGPIKDDLTMMDNFLSLKDFLLFENLTETVSSLQGRAYLNYYVLAAPLNFLNFFQDNTPRSSWNIVPLDEKQP